MTPRKDKTDQIKQDWENFGDEERAVAESTEVLEEIIDGRRDPVRYFRLFEAAAEPQFDGPGGKAILVLYALEAADRAFLEAEKRAAERAGSLNSAERIRWRAQPAYMLARTWHILPDTPRRALETSYRNLCFLLDLAETAEGRIDGTDGYEAMCEQMASPLATPLAEEAVAAVSIFLAVIKRNSDKIKPAAVERLIDICRGLVKAYVLDESGALKKHLVVYPKTPALAAQGFYTFHRHGNPQDAGLVAALYQLDVRTRESLARPQATCCLREMEWARRLGDLEGAERYRRQALVDLLPLPRHRDIVVRLGYV